MRTKFHRTQHILAYDGESIEEVIGGPHDGKRLHIQFAAFWEEGKYTYTREEFKHEVEETIGYVHWEGNASTFVPDKIVRALNDARKANHDAAVKKYPDWRTEPVEYLKGTCRIVWRNSDDLGDGYDWEFRAVPVDAPVKETLNLLDF